MCETKKFVLSGTSVTGGAVLENVTGIKHPHYLSDRESERVLQSEAMSHTIPAIFENGVFRPLQKVDLNNGEEVEVILLDRVDSTAKRSREILAEIADLPIEGNTNGFSGEDHDQILYPKE